jgi:hypothetical protein
MNVLDENIGSDQRELLQRWRVRVRHIGHDLGQPGIQDSDIVPLLLTLPRPTLFTRDTDFFRRSLCHAPYSIVVLNVRELDTAHSVRRFLRHPAFKAQAKRMGKIALVGYSGIRFWRLHAMQEELVSWA